MRKEELLEALKNFDTPSITNVVATYPQNRELCLGLYDPWECEWYTDQTLKCMYPQLGRVVGYAVTVVYGLPNPNFSRLSFDDVLRAIDASLKPVIVCIKQDFPENIKKKNGLSGGNMTIAMKSLGAVGVISDGPSRDIDEIREMRFQYMLTGVTVGHGAFAVKAVNVPVNICGMDISPGEIIHMDENGAVKFPAEKLEDVYNLGRRLAEIEQRQMAKVAASSDVEEIIRIRGGAQKE
ncbi:MAG: RraA family protein [Clostridiales bacterium]|jgi:regulator of RNase E activity RraA|nr:RraA family protein [Clostridiales bacterium]